MLILKPSELFSKQRIDFKKFENLDPTFVSRYLLQAGILDTYQQRQKIKKLKVLDVGGAGSIIQKFIDIDLTIIDKLLNKKSLVNYVEGDALNMPFDDNSFDVVISCDVLEHIPNPDRVRFVEESARVTKDLIVLAAPFNIEGVRPAEIAANNFYKQLIGTDHLWLNEHLQDELPNLQQTQLIINHSGLNAGHFSHTALQNWQLITRAGFLLTQAKKHPEFTKRIEELNQYYLNNVMAKDFSKNGYRTFIVASKINKVKIDIDEEQYSSQLDNIFTLLTNAILTLLWEK